jgi:tetratricopeptide (TPR) repeat protein
MRQLTHTLLVAAAAMLLLVACGEDSQPPVDIDATVEARLAQALTAVPTPTLTPEIAAPADVSVQEAQQALQDADEAIRLNPQDAEAYYDRGVAYTNLGQYERAIQDADEAIRLNPHTPRPTTTGETRTAN